MESEPSAPSSEDPSCCATCGWTCSCSSGFTSSSDWLRSVKRKYEEYQEKEKFFLPGKEYDAVARVQIENEIMALRDMVASQQQVINALGKELEEERNASSSAASEAMSMILRLQREKAETQMEARQFKAFVEEKMGHDQLALSALEDLLFKKEQAIQSLICEVQAYRHRMLSYGISESEVDGDSVRSPRYGRSNSGITENSNEYPPLRCHFNARSGAWEDDEEEEDAADIEKYAHGETPISRGRLKDLEYRIQQMEHSSYNNQGDVEENIPEKIIVGQSPRKSVHQQEFSGDSVGSRSMLGHERALDMPFHSPRHGCSFDSLVPDNINYMKHNNTPDADDDASETRTCVIDSVQPVQGNQDPDIAKLYMRLQALEADRESLKQAIVSMQTDKAQMLLIKEIAQRLCEDMSPQRTKSAGKRSHFGGFFGLVKWVIRLPFFSRKGRRPKYMFGVSPGKVGLMLLLENKPRNRRWRYLTRTEL